jgi:hypothetical protein
MKELLDTDWLSLIAAGGLRMVLVGTGAGNTHKYAAVAEQGRRVDLVAELKNYARETAQ